MAPTSPNRALRRARELRGWSQEDVAEQIGAPSSKYISRWECGEVVPGPYYRQKLCHLFGMNAQELGFVRVPKETPDEEPGGEEEQILNPDLAPSREQEHSESTSSRNTSWLIRHKRSLLIVVLLFLLGTFVLSIFLRYVAPKRTWPHLQYNPDVKNSAVMIIQYMLEARGYNLSSYGADGFYGSVTESAVKTFQKVSHLSENNGVDDPTWEHLIVPSEKGDHGSQVQALQVQLNARHIVKPALAIDGDFGAATEQAVRQFQQINHLPVTGKANLDVWCLLVGGSISR